MAFGTLAIPVMDVIAKVLVTDGLSGWHVALARFVAQGLLTLLLMPLMVAQAGAAGKGGVIRPVVDDLRAACTWTNAARGVALASATGLFFSGLRYLSLPTSTAILFLTPLILTLLGGVVLRERVKRGTVLLCLTGFPCVLLITRPGTDVVGMAALLPLMAAFCFAGYFLLTRMAAKQGSPLAMLVVAAFTGAVFLAAVTVSMGAVHGDSGRIFQPLDGSAWLALAAIGIVSTAAHVAITVAFSQAPASSLAPLNYLEIVSATILSFLVFGTLPDMPAVVGAVLIALIGLKIVRSG
ncbi:DMT family transporter [Rhizobiaceae bacterium BDR2-2]|uniref:DMT family transporter n=1 Tax=Ectorhizobium quercum TaxID=2965071 RepID=A0AAE3MXJ8_9HYPH|nr:DMT family transporter [Ectorhizobium quercum]MCX8995520.1 DMT family transporter [Ectorhizobium quercum]